VVGTHAVGRPGTTCPWRRRVSDGDARSNIEGAAWRLWFPARSGGDPSVKGGPPRQALHRNFSNRALGRAHGRLAVARGDWISDGAGLHPSGFHFSPTLLAFLLNWWNSLFMGALVAATLAVAGWVSERAVWAGRRPSSSPCDGINCVLDDESPLGFGVIRSHVGRGCAVGCFSEKFH